MDQVRIGGQVVQKDERDGDAALVHLRHNDVVLSEDGLGEPVGLSVVGVGLKAERRIGHQVSDGQVVGDLIDAKVCQVVRAVDEVGREQNTLLSAAVIPCRCLCGNGLGVRDVLCIRELGQLSADSANHNELFEQHAARRVVVQSKGKGLRLSRSRICHLSALDAALIGLLRIQVIQTVVGCLHGSRHGHSDVGSCDQSCRNCQLVGSGLGRCRRGRLLCCRRSLRRLLCLLGGLCLRGKSGQGKGCHHEQNGGHGFQNASFSMLSHV